jgi:tRNA(fMet)-specific endonuclease VapC
MHVLPRPSSPFLATLPHMELLPFDQAAAELAGRIAGDLERIGQPIGVADTMIAAIAIENGLELVTGNTSDYQRVQQLGYPLVLEHHRQPADADREIMDQLLESILEPLLTI